MNRGTARELACAGKLQLHAVPGLAVLDDFAVSLKN